MTTFHPFPRLPWELRARVWELTVEPRTVEVDLRYNHPITRDMATRYFLSLGAYTRNPEHVSVLHLRSSTPVPAPLQTCLEARIHLTEEDVMVGRHTGRPFYKKAFDELPEAKANEWKDIPLPAQLRLELGLTPLNEPRRYVWINFDLDMLSIGERRLYEFKPYYKDIKRLKIAREFDDVYNRRFGNLRWVYNLHEFRNYLLLVVNLRELHVVCLDGLKYWRTAAAAVAVAGAGVGAGAGEARPGPGPGPDGGGDCTCPYFPASLSEDKVLLIDNKTGKRRTYAENKKRRRR
ncbi:hypothetical protein B0T20DRAFT_407277 [Sordaria brevicollis]|uniref:2EXR domain-containing protein n=1 Tax=Sordaria brevicollis TaxID=83679 RepID=A0AAE0UDK4_SORBR|nr:hypothetical protein B0T20DRAFT_407277 [Sordaria brevicollis]